ncbi:MAG: hypothetical protein CFE43_20170 [Burkholderiales bacterium PBB3]|nr:MAG: hypothetical protein CFE43_20170 [Burkholderiales bacterium PBB3]
MRLSINFRSFSAGLAFAVLGAIGATLSFSAQALDLRVINKSDRIAYVTVTYADQACAQARSDKLAPGKIWSNDKRGSCMIWDIGVALWPLTPSSDPSVSRGAKIYLKGSPASDFEVKMVGDAASISVLDQPIDMTPVPVAAPNPGAGQLRIVNKTAFRVIGGVTYPGCRGDRFELAAGAWVLIKRGACLVTAIEGSVFRETAGQIVPPVIPYKSSGTGYSDFTITAAGDNNTYRIWSAAELASLPPPAVQWGAVQALQPPPDAAFKGGRQRFGGKNDVAGNPFFHLLPVCRGQVDGAFAIGNAAPFYTHAGGWSWDVYHCYVFLNGAEQELADYEVMRVDAQLAAQNAFAVQWVNAANGALPANALNVAKSGQSLYACRAQTAESEGALRVGMVGQGGCLFPYGGQNRLSATYEVLVVDRSAKSLLSKGANEPRLADAPDRPAAQSKAGEDCAALSARCQSRLDALRAMGAYRINSVHWSMNSSDQRHFKKTLGGVWEGIAGNGERRYYAEVERVDSRIILFSGNSTAGSRQGLFWPEKLTFGISDGLIDDSRTNYIGQAAMAEPDTALSLTMRPLNPAQSITFWKGGSQPAALVRNRDGQFGSYKIASSGDGWLELYTLVSQGGAWNIQFLAIDFYRNRVWELLGVTGQRPSAQDPNALRALAKSAGPNKAWAEAYELTNAPTFSGVNIGAVLGRMSGAQQQVAWTLREEVGGSTLKWEELKSEGAAAQRSIVDGNPVGRLLTETGRTASSLTLSGSEYGTITIDWVAGSVSAGGKRIGDFLTGDSEYVGQRKKIPSPTPPGISPGFQFVNKTDWPVMVKVSQVGCLYHGVVQPRTTMTRNTGAVWFALSAAWAADGKDLTTEQVLSDCVMPVATTVVGVIATAASGGSLGGVIALGTTAAVAGGAASTAVSFMNAGGSSQLEQDAVVASIYVVAAAATGGVGAFQVVSAKMAAGTTATVARTTLAAAAARGAAREGLVALRDEAINLAAFAAANYVAPSEADYTTLQSWFDKEINLAGQYAGYPWPWKMKDRVMPQYEITGGPRVDTLKDGSKLIRKGSPFSFRRVN